MNYEKWHKDLPEYSADMHLRGYSPEQILMANRKAIYKDMEEEKQMEQFFPRIKMELIKK